MDKYDKSVVYANYCTAAKSLLFDLIIRHSFRNYLKP